MNTPDAARDDLAYVAQALRRAHEPDQGLASIYFLWALITPMGFALADFAPAFCGLYWLGAGPLGGLLSVWLGVRADHQRGESNREQGVREGLHWLVMMPGFVLTALPMLTGVVSWEGGQSYFLLVCGIAYALAGVHLHRPMLWVGMLMMAGYAALVLLRPPYAWTITGILAGLGLALAGWQATRRV